MSQLRFSRFGLLLAGVVIIAAACGDAETTADPVAATVGPAPAPTTPDQTTIPSPSRLPAVGALPTGPSALDSMTNSDFPDPLVDPQEVRSGGPPPDGIPPIEDPQFLPVIDHLDLLPLDEPVVALEVDGDARAYPVRIMIWHEIVNDTVGGVPVSVTYCPLCNSAVSYVREIDGVETTFGTSGRLYASALVMYDRATESLWTHFDGRAVIGVLTGTELEVLASPLMSWESFVSTYPDGQVLDETRTGFDRRYGANPYVGYDDPDARPFLFAGDVDARERAMQRVIGIEIEDAALALSLAAVSGSGPSALAVAVGDADLVVLWEPGQSTALESRSIDGGRDVGTTGVFRPATEDGPLTFEIDDAAIRDIETGSTWTSTGVAVDGPLAGTTLERVAHLDTFWFAWSTYQPDTELLTAP